MSRTHKWKSKVIIFLILVVMFATLEYLFDFHNLVLSFSWYIIRLRIREKPPLPLCQHTQPNFGPIKLNKTSVTLDWVEKRYPEIRGGRYSPPNCSSKHKVAIVVPFRNRYKHLPIFLNHMHYFLMKQQLEYGIFVVEQLDSGDFNRGKLLNIGFVESQKFRRGGWHCFIMHDIDLLPLDLRIAYSCPRKPRIMSVALDNSGFKSGSITMGGVSAMTAEQFREVNGFSNRYWGWGAEDDDLYNRLELMGYKIVRNLMSVSHYATLVHKEQPYSNPIRFHLLTLTQKHFKHDGLSSLKYKVIQVIQHQLFTQISVDINMGLYWLA